MYREDIMGENSINFHSPKIQPRPIGKKYALKNQDWSTCNFMKKKIVRKIVI